MTRVLDPWRALVRLWLFGSIVWVGFWLWRDGSGCFTAKSGQLWCPNAGGDSVTMTSYGRLALHVLGPPLVLLLMGLAFLWFARGAQRPPKE